MSQSVIEQIERDTKDAMRARDKVRLGALRRASATIKNAEIEARGELSEDQVLSALRKLVKQHDESIDHFRAGGREDLVATERAEREMLVAYLPAQLDESAIEDVVRRIAEGVGAEGPKDMGPVMKGAMAELRGRADGQAVKNVVEGLLKGER